jgi:hypothetical protein
MNQNHPHVFQARHRLQNSNATTPTFGSRRPTVVFIKANGNTLDVIESTSAALVRERSRRINGKCLGMFSVHFLDSCWSIAL